MIKRFEKEKIKLKKSTQLTMFSVEFRIMQLNQQQRNEQFIKCEHRIGASLFCGHLVRFNSLFVIMQSKSNDEPIPMIFWRPD